MRTEGPGSAATGVEEGLARHLVEGIVDQTVVGHHRQSPHLTQALDHSEIVIYPGPLMTALKLGLLKREESGL